MVSFFFNVNCLMCEKTLIAFRQKISWNKLFLSLATSFSFMFSGELNHKWVFMFVMETWKMEVWGYKKPLDYTPNGFVFWISHTRLQRAVRVILAVTVQILKRLFASFLPWKVFLKSGPLDSKMNDWEVMAETSLHIDCWKLKSLFFG